MPKRALRTAVSTVTSVFVILVAQTVSLISTTPAVADPANTACEESAPMAGNELAARALASQCGVEVEVAEDADEYSGVFAQPDGRLTYRNHVEPYRARVDRGPWNPIDATLVVGPDGQLLARNVVTPVEFSGGGDAPFATMRKNGKSLGLTWPGVLPTPVVSGNTATYANVLAGVDLVVRALPEGFSHDLVVHSAQAAANPKLKKIRLGLVHDGLDVTVSDEGGFAVTDADTGEEFTSTPPPAMWDTPPSPAAKGMSAMTEGPSPDLDIASVEVEATPDTIALVPDQELLTGAGTQYPVVIDPMWPGGKRDNEWGSVWSKYPTQLSWKGGSPSLNNGSTYGNAGAGQTCDSWSQLTCTSSKYKIRSFFRMDTEAVTRNPNRDVLGARFKILQRFSADCNASNARLWSTSIIESSHTWNNQPTWHDDTTSWSTGDANHGTNCGGPGYVEFDVGTMAQQAKDGAWYSFTVGLRANNESPSPDLAQWRRYDAATAVVEIDFNSRPQTPSRLSTDGKGCTTTAPGLWTTTLTPRLTATPWDDDGGSVNTIFDLNKADGTLLKEWSVTSSANNPVTTTIPTGVLPSMGAYYWQAKTQDNRLTSAATDKCYFQVDDSPPTTPTATLVTTDPIVGQPVEFRFDGPLDTSTFAYALTGGATTETPAANGTASIKVTPPKTSIDHVMQVWAKDSAGNLSNRFDLSFTTRLPSQTGYWPLAGDGTDKSGSHDLTIPTAATWVNDSFGQPSSAMHLDGTGCAKTASPVVDTTKSFTVATWTRATAEKVGSGHDLVAQYDIGGGGFELQAATFSPSGEFKFIFSVQGFKADGTHTSSLVISDTVVKPDAWHHVVGAYDASAKEIRLYIDGVPAGREAASMEMRPTVAPLYTGCRGPGNTPYTGDIHDVRVFDSAVTAEQAGAVAAKPTGFWSMNQTGTDAVGGNNLTFHGDHTWVDDRLDNPQFAYGLNLGGNAYAQSANTGVRTDESFTVAGWVKLADKSVDRTLVSQAATIRGSFYIEYLASVDRWQFTMPSSDARTVSWNDARANTAPELNSWYHLAGVYDASLSQLRFYVNGELQATVNAPATPWHVDGPVLIGATGDKAGNRWNYMSGAIDEIRLYSGVLDDRRLTDIACGSATLCGVA